MWLSLFERFEELNHRPFPKETKIETVSHQLMALISAPKFHPKCKTTNFSACKMNEIEARSTEINLCLTFTTFFIRLFFSSYFILLDKYFWTSVEFFLLKNVLFLALSLNYEPFLYCFLILVFNVARAQKISSAVIGTKLNFVETRFSMNKNYGGEMRRQQEKHYLHRD